MEPVTQADLARVFTAHFDRLQGVDLMIKVLLSHLHDRGLIEADWLAGAFHAAADAAEQAQSPCQAIACRVAGDTCHFLAGSAPAPEPGRPGWLDDLLRHDDD